MSDGVLMPASVPVSQDVCSGTEEMRVEDSQIEETLQVKETQIEETQVEDSQIEVKMVVGPDGVLMPARPYKRVWVAPGGVLTYTRPGLALIRSHLAFAI